MLGQTTNNSDSLDSPRPGLGGSHHLPPYSLLCTSTPQPHPNGTFSWDSRSGVPKLSRFGLSRLWDRSDLRLGWGLKQSCSPLWKLSNGLWHFTCIHQGRVNSRLLVVGNQTTSLTPGPSFASNSCWRCRNGSCEAILDIYTSRPFQGYEEHLNVKCFGPCNRVLHFQESRRTPKSHFRECEWWPHTSLKVGLRQLNRWGRRFNLWDKIKVAFNWHNHYLRWNILINECYCYRYQNQWKIWIRIRDIRSRSSKSSGFNKKTIKFNVRPKTSLEDKVYLETFYHHSQVNIEVDETLAKI